MNKILILYIDEDQLNDFVLALVKHKLRVQLPSYNLLLKKNGKILRSTLSVPIDANYYDEERDAENVEADSATTIAVNTIVGAELSMDKSDDKFSASASAADKSIVVTDESSNQIAASDTSGSNSQLAAANTFNEYNTAACIVKDELSVVGDDNSNTSSVVDNTSATSATPTNANSIRNVSTEVSVVDVNPTKQHQRKRRRPSFTVTQPKTKPRKDCSGFLKSKFLLFFEKTK